MSDEDTFDYVEWARQLRQKLISRDAAYRRFEADGDAVLPFGDGSEGTAVDAARLEAVSALSELLGAIIQLPAFEADLTGVGLKPLSDLAAAVAGLHRGHSSSLLDTRKFGRDRRPPEHDGNFRKGQRQAMSCFIVELLDRAGSPHAGREAASLLARHGMRGRKRVDGIAPAISHKVLEKWAAEIQGEECCGHRRKYLNDLRETARVLGPPGARLLAERLAKGVMEI